MGEHDVPLSSGEERMRAFSRALLDDLQALESLLVDGRIESDVRRIGAEQEIVLVDRALRPAQSALAVLERVGHPQVTTELGIFNLELNLRPRVLAGDCLAALEAELDELLQLTASAADAEDTRLVLCGILPTLGLEHLDERFMTPLPRYRRLATRMTELAGGRFRTLIKGLDQLQVTCDNVMLEACNTSFQLHFQVGGEEFARLYNVAQVVLAPVLAAAVNSPVMLQHRLWHETRIALLQQSLDTRNEARVQRGERRRVRFGDRWVEDSVLEIFRDDVARFRSIVDGGFEESSSERVRRGETPALRALCLHNGTIYRWNRPCYGVLDGKPHLRIENRALPAGPTVVDECANAAFYFGLMSGLDAECDDVRRRIAFDDAKGNFLAAARGGLTARLRWLDGTAFDADRLILDHLLPLARRGLERRGIHAADIERFLGVLHDRVASGRTGARWALDGLARMEGHGRPEQRYRRLTEAMVAGTASGDPVHTWPLATLGEDESEPDSFRTLGQIMTRDVFTVHPDDLVDIAAAVMDWRHVRHVPVEDEGGRLVGLLSHRTLLRALLENSSEPDRALPVRCVMRSDPVTATPDTGCLEAIERMRAHRISCLPIVEGAKLVGIVSERDLIDVSASLLERWLREG